MNIQSLLTSGRKTYIIGGFLLAYLLGCLFTDKIHFNPEFVFVGLGLMGITIRHGMETNKQAILAAVVDAVSNQAKVDLMGTTPLSEYKDMAVRADQATTPSTGSQAKTLMAIIVLIGISGFFGVGCAWFKTAVPNSPERIAKITSDALLDQAWFAETNYAYTLAQKQKEARASGDTNRIAQLATNRAYFVYYVNTFRGEYTNALHLYLSVKPKEQTNEVTAADLIKFQNGFGTAITNLLRFVESTSAVVK